jgi:hypothetical protein
MGFREKIENLKENTTKKSPTLKGEGCLIHPSPRVTLPLTTNSSKGQLKHIHQTNWRHFPSRNSFYFINK